MVKVQSFFLRPALALSLLLLGAAAALAATASTAVGNVGGDAGWYFRGTLDYTSYDTSGMTEMYDWSSANAAKLYLGAAVNYNDETVLYRAAIIYGADTIVWESCPQAQMDETILHDDSGDLKQWSPTPHATWEGELNIPVIYKVQSAADGQGPVAPTPATLLHNQG